MSKLLHIAHLYPKEMNIYGDTGNRIILQKRLEWRGIEVRTTYVGIGDDIPQDVDIIIGGGSQDAGQEMVQDDLLAKGKKLRSLADDGVVMLMVCGLYQLFGRRMVTQAKVAIKGVGIFPLETVAGRKRLIGNTVIASEWGELVGYENHSGKTTLDADAQPLGKIIKGDGNNGNDVSEGCIYKNVFGTYAHGPILSKNPAFADELISRALTRKYGKSELNTLDDALELQAADVAKARPR